MNKVTEAKKSQVLKTLAIIGFLAVIALIAWFSVQLVNVAPNAFSSLASLADSVQQYQNQIVDQREDKQDSSGTLLVVTSNKSLVDTGETIVLNWTEARVPGSYVFAYDCADGVAIDIVSEDGVRSVACNTNYNIGNVNTLAIAVDSEKDRYADVTYSLSFLGTSDVEPSATDSANLTVVNTKIALVTETETEIVETETNIVAEEEISTETEVAPEVVTETSEENTVEEVISEPETQPEVPEPETVTYEQQFTYTIPVSDPNGRVDLSTRFLSVGTIVDNQFYTGDVYAIGEGAIQFEVRNLGTKTSEEWTFRVSLPNGQQYDSGTQAVLKPNERATITIGFPAPERSGHTFTVTLDTEEDGNALNNQFSQTVSFVQ